jgi:hypothetical protein
MNHASRFHRSEVLHRKPLFKTLDLMPTACQFASQLALSVQEPTSLSVVALLSGRA